MSTAFIIVHATSGRTRIKWAGDSSDKAIISEIADNITGVQGVDKAVPRMTTGSIIIEHEQVDWPALESELADRLSLEFSTPAPAEPRTAMDTINQGLDQVNGALKGINTDLGSVTVLLLLILAVAQSLRGQVTVSPLSSIWYALSIAAMARNTAGETVDATAESIE